MADETVVVTVPQTNKRNDTMATVIGMAQAMAVSIADFMAHLGPNGLNWKAPLFWIGLVMAALAGLQGYYSNRGGTSTQVVAKQTGDNATVKVETKQPS